LVELENSYALGFSLPHADHKYDWAYFSEPEKHLDARRMYCPLDRICGGSSFINGMAYVGGYTLIGKTNSFSLSAACLGRRTKFFSFASYLSSVS